MMHKNNVGKMYEWLPYIGLVFGLVLVYISAVHSVEKKVREITTLSKENDELKREYFMITNKYIYNQTYNQLIKDLKADHEKVVIPKKIVKTDA